MSYLHLHQGLASLLNDIPREAVHYVAGFPVPPAIRSAGVHQVIVGWEEPGGGGGHMEAYTYLTAEQNMTEREREREWVRRRGQSNKGDSLHSLALTEERETYRILLMARLERSNTALM